MAFDTALEEAFRAVGRGIAAARIAVGDAPDAPPIDIGPEVAPLSDAQRARMIEALGRQLQRDAADRGAPWGAADPSPDTPRH